MLQLRNARLVIVGVSCRLQHTWIYVHWYSSKYNNWPVKVDWDPTNKTSHHSVPQQCIQCCKGNTASQWEMAIVGCQNIPEPID